MDYMDAILKKIGTLLLCIYSPMTCIFEGKPVNPLKTRPNFHSKPGAPIWKAAAGRNMETSSQTRGAKGGS